VSAASRAVGVLGIGAMGLAMAGRLAARGHRVTVCDIDPARIALATDLGLPSADAVGLAAACEVLVVAVVDAAQVRQALLGPQGAFGGASACRARAVLLCPTIAPDDVLEVASRLAALGVACLDTPMSGGPARARDGTMSLMVAGDPAVVDAHAALLADLADPVVRLGPRLGDGARAKLVNNLLAGANLAAAAEAFALAERVGLDPTTALALVERSSGQSWIGSDRLRRRLAAGDAPVQPVAAAMALLAKDTALAQAMAEAAGFRLAVTAPAVQAFAAACAAGRTGEDDAHQWDWQRDGRPGFPIG
jgi:3-hydroxyisobutyrate dehydrogenase-like beta-hydroxyacid dehydrogenase